MANVEIIKLIGEKFVIANDFSPRLPANTQLISGALFVTQLGKTQTTMLTAPASIGDLTLSLDDNVKAGAALILNYGQVDEEPLLVKSISGSGPYIAVLASAVQVAHDVGEPVKYDPGATDLVLANPVATIAGTSLGANIVGGLVYKYRIVFLATISNGQIVRDDAILILKD